MAAPPHATRCTLVLPTLAAAWDVCQALAVCDNVTAATDWADRSIVEPSPATVPPCRFVVAYNETACAVESRVQLEEAPSVAHTTPSGVPITRSPIGRVPGTLVVPCLTRTARVAVGAARVWTLASGVVVECSFTWTGGTYAEAWRRRMEAEPPVCTVACELVGGDAAATRHVERVVEWIVATASAAGLLLHPGAPRPWFALPLTAASATLLTG